MDWQKIQADVEKDFRNTSLQKVWEDAPTDLSRRYRFLRIYVEAFETTEEETTECLAEIYDMYGRMSLEDWKYVYRHCHILEHDLKGLAISRIMRMETRALSYEDWVREFTVLDGRRDPYWIGYMKRIYEQVPGKSSAGGQGAGT